MTTATHQLDVSGTAAVPFARLVRVEVRKMADTRAGMWLLIIMGALAGVVPVLFLIFAPDSEKSFVNLVTATGAVQGNLLPVLGILLVTSEWSQRTAMVTFSLTPLRSRVVWAKVAAALFFGLVVIVLVFAFAALLTAIGGAPDAWTGAGRGMFYFLLLQEAGTLLGLAFGLVLLNSAAAIVLYFVVPGVFSIIFNVVPALRSSGPWLDYGTATQPMAGGEALSGEQWAHLATSSALWIALPFVLGLWRVLRAEVK